MQLSRQFPPHWICGDQVDSIALALDNASLISSSDLNVSGSFSGSVFAGGVRMALRHGPPLAEETSMGRSVALGRQYRSPPALLLRVIDPGSS